MLGGVGPTRCQPRAASVPRPKSHWRPDRVVSPGRPNVAGRAGARPRPPSGTIDRMDTPTLPPDPEAYDTERNVHARKRGLAAPYIAGGRDPAPQARPAPE